MTQIEELIKEARYVKPERLEKFDWINVLNYEFQYQLPLENGTIIVGVNHIELMRPIVDPLQVTDDFGKELQPTEEDYIKLQTLIDGKTYAN